MPSSDCYNIASDYGGTISKTVGGVNCQLWSENSPHEHEFHDDATFPDGNVTVASNYCRSPDNGTVPWCYTNDTDVRWDNCNVPICRGMNCSGKTILSRVLKNRLFAYAKTKTQISFAVTAKLISAFVFATRIVQSLYFLNPTFQASNHLL